MRAACFLRAYAGAPVTRTLHTSLLRCGERPCDTLRAHPENAARYRCAAPLLFTSCGSVVREISPVRWVRRWFSMCAPCLTNWGGGGCRGLMCCVVVRCFACRSEDVHRTSSQQHGRLQTHESPPQPKSHSGQSFQKVIRLQDRPNPRHKLTEILHVLTLLQQANAKTGRNLSIILKRQIKRAAIH